MYLITLLGSTPQLAAMTTFGSACSIRVHSSLAAKPTNKWKINQDSIEVSKKHNFQLFVVSESLEARSLFI